MEKKPFTLDYFGKPVACFQEGDTYTVQISYTPVKLQHITVDGITKWIDKDQNRESDLSKDLGRLIEQQYLQK